MRSVIRATALATGLGVPMAVLVSSGALAGLALDKKYHANPWFTVAGIVLGAVGAVVNAIQVLAWYERRSGRQG